MKIHSFISHSAADAVEQIRTRLGPGAVVVDVRRPRTNGLSRFWQRNRVEVLAGVPEEEREAAEARVPIPEAELTNVDKLRESPKGGLAGVPRHRAAILHEATARSLMAEWSANDKPHPDETLPEAEGVEHLGEWAKERDPLVVVLRSTGMSEPTVARLVGEYRKTPGDALATSIGCEEQLRRLGGILSGRLVARGRCERTTHVFLGVPGCGKTTVLSKWMARMVLVEGQPASVWRLDGRTANMAESLSLHCEILGVPIQRQATTANGSMASGQGAMFIDLPGINANDGEAIEDMKQRIQSFGPVNVHLVLNLAYDTELLMEQVRGFAGLGVADLILTHLDEEHRWGKGCEVALGTNLPIRFLSAGQNVPGQLVYASPELLLTPQTRRHQRTG